MKQHRLEDMFKGWFVGSFAPSAHDTNACEVAVKKYFKGDQEDLHHHKIATEVTLILSGQVKMMGKIFQDGDIIVLEPSEVTDFEAITDAVTVVVKTPSVSGDKFLNDTLL